MSHVWSIDSWRQKKAAQQPPYQDQKQLQEVCNNLQRFPPLVFVGEVEKLKSYLADAARGKRFLLQGGDCAESFKDCNAESITSKLKILLQMSVILCYGARRPVIRVGRIAGQYGKPRSNQTEIVDGKELPVFRGDNVNSLLANLDARKPDPARLLEGYFRSALTLNYIRALTTGGFADLHYPDHWNLDFFATSEHTSRYLEITAQIKDAIAFMESLGSRDQSMLGSVEFFTSHEGLILAYEETMTRFVGSKYYNLGAHMLWIGDRTRQLDGAHIEYFRGIANPIGIKIGPSANRDEIIKVIKILNPNNEAGRITLITRFGDKLVTKFLPQFIKSISDAGLEVCWSADPMHGNAIKASNGIKTRDFDAICGELTDTFAIHHELGTQLGGVHFELTGENVTECTGGSAGITVEDLPKSYESYCDPRLNYSQSLEMAFLISQMLQKYSV